MPFLIVYNSARNSYFPTKHELKLKLFMYYFIILVAIAFITKIFAKLYSIEDIIF